MLTASQILSAQDIATKEVDVPEWGGSILIKQLTRGQQDEYLKRQFGSRMKQDAKARTQELDLSNMYGHDAYLLVCSVCDESGKSLFTASQIDALKQKNGEIIGRIAKEILQFSGMVEDDKVARGETTEAAQLADEIKN